MEYGFPSDSITNKIFWRINYFELSSKLNVEWEIHSPFYGLQGSPSMEAV
jgi:hypothetical protein